jgi:FAD:protein FMN transferase
MKKQFYVFGTVISIDFVSENEDIIMDEIIGTVYRLDDEMSIYKEDSIISNINKNAGIQEVKVSSDVMHVVKEAIKYSKITNGELDITSKPVIDIVKAGNFGIDKINEKIKLINYKNIIINEENNTIKLKHVGMGIDLGSMVKGYASDLIVDILNKYNIANALIDLGGNIYVKGLYLDNIKWNVGIQDPTGERYSTIGILNLSNKSIVTSGNYERANHIISPKTGLPVNGEILSVSIISNLSIYGEGLSTACYVMGLENGLKLIEETDDIDAIFVTCDKKVYCTNNIKKEFVISNDEYKIIESYKG